ncbi:MAG: hypothetical protein KatS3mg065_0336 [Chloroflexota bacterium]|nr:MAG: hypothetical protein KatS3mg065_0336 [Chloroflexota bacterium]
MYAALVAPERCADQAELLRAFDLPIALLQDAEALERVAAELVEDKASEGVRYVEIRWGPLLHVRRGLDLGEGIAAVCRGAAEASRRTGVVVRLIATALRSHEPEANRRLAEVAARFQAEGLVGWDLAGPEAAFPDPLLHRAAFEMARAAGLRITVHAGEWGGAAQVRRALALDPERIAHGPGAASDPDLCRELAARGDRPRPLPDEQRPGRDRALHRRPSPGPAPRRGGPGHPLDGRSDGLGRHPPRGVPPGGRGPRPRPAHPVDHRPRRPRGRLRRADRPRAPAGRIRRLRRPRPGARAASARDQAAS